MKIPDQIINFKIDIRGISRKPPFNDESNKISPGFITDRLYEEIKKNTEFDFRCDIDDFLMEPLRNMVSIDLKSFLIRKTYEDYIQCNKDLLD